MWAGLAVMRHFGFFADSLNLLFGSLGLHGERHPAGATGDFLLYPEKIELYHRCLERERNTGRQFCGLRFVRGVLSADPGRSN